jgi:hypothetical protein
MKKFFSKNAGAIGVASTTSFAVALLWYSVVAPKTVPAMVFGIGGLALLLMSYSLWALLS